jgi:photosystem II stability/assembly factor-like uncharacterized protein
MGVSGRRLRLCVGLATGSGALVLAAVLLASPGDAASCPCWRSASRGMPPAVYVLAVAADPRRPGTLYAGTITHGLQKSVDGGATWNPVAGAFPLLGEAITERPAAIISLALDPSRRGLLYAGTSSGGILRTADGGASWTTANRGLAGLTARSGGSVYLPVAALVVDPARPRTLYASVLGAGVFKSVDAGARWQRARAGLPSPNVEALVLDPAHPGTLYAGTEGEGVFKSLDGGMRWQAAGLAGTYVEALGFERARPQVVYAGTLDGGVFGTDDGGSHWHAASNGLGNGYVRALVPDQRRPGTVYAGTLGGVFVTADGGGRWRPLNNGLRNRLVQALLLVGDTLYAGTLGSGIYALHTGAG